MSAPVIARSRLRRVTRAPKDEGREGTRGCPLSTTFGERLRGETKSGSNSFDAPIDVWIA